MGTRSSEGGSNCSGGSETSSEELCTVKPDVDGLNIRGSRVGVSVSVVVVVLVSRAGSVIVVFTLYLKAVRGLIKVLTPGCSRAGLVLIVCI